MEGVLGELDGEEVGLNGVGLNGVGLHGGVTRP